MSDRICGRWWRGGTVHHDTTLPYLSSTFTPLTLLPFSLLLRLSLLSGHPLTPLTPLVPLLPLSPRFSLLRRLLLLPRLPSYSSYLLTPGTQCERILLFAFPRRSEDACDASTQTRIRQTNHTLSRTTLYQVARAFTGNTSTSCHVTHHAHGYGETQGERRGPETDRRRHQATMVGVVQRGGRRQQRQVAQRDNRTR